MYVTDDHICTHNTIISGSFTEFSFFHLEGWSDEKILTFFTKMRQRIDSRMKGSYYGRCIIDSSPDTLESVIDNWIWNEAPKDPKNYIITGSRWKYFPEDFPEFFDEKHNEKHDFTNGFPLFKGGNGVPATVIENEAQLAQYVPQDIMWCPVKQITNSGIINFKNSAEENPIEFMKDWGGIPAGAADRILYNGKWIEHIFDNKLKNIFTTIIAKTEDEPEHLIWNQVKDKLFKKLIDRYYFYYEPELGRVITVDLAISGDTASISASHVERDVSRVDSLGNPLKVYVTDFVIPVVPKGGMINLDAFKFFIQDLIKLGNMNIKHVSFDGFQSRSIMQSLERFGVQVDLLSVDKNNGPYLSLIDYITHLRYYCGKSVMVKNNLLSLIMSKRKVSGTTKIDHTNGDNIYTDSFAQPNQDYTDYAWANSLIGKNAKDTTDCIAGNIALLDQYETEFPLMTAWDATKEIERTYDGEKKKVDEFSKRIFDLK